MQPGKSVRFQRALHIVAPCCAPNLRIVILSQLKLSAGHQVWLRVVFSKSLDGGAVNKAWPSSSCGMVVQGKGFCDESERLVRFCSCFQRVRSFFALKVFAEQL